MYDLLSQISNLKVVAGNFDLPSLRCEGVGVARVDSPLPGVYEICSRFRFGRMVLNLAKFQIPELDVNIGLEVSNRGTVTVSLSNSYTGEPTVPMNGNRLHFIFIFQ